MRFLRFGGGSLAPNTFLDLRLFIEHQKMSQRPNYYEDEIDDAEDYEEVGLNLAIGNYGQAGIYEDGSQSKVQPAAPVHLD